MNKSTFTYVTYIRTTPERLWEALTSAEFTAQYWFGAHCESDWTAGSPWRLMYADGRVADSGQVVEAIPPRRIAIKWRNEWNPELKAEGDSLCTMDIEPVADTSPQVVRLSIAHTIERAESKFIGAVSGGWPRILSNLKSLLETGDVAMKTK